MVSLQLLGTRSSPPQKACFSSVNFIFNPLDHYRGRNTRLESSSDENSDEMASSVEMEIELLLLEMINSPYFDPKTNSIRKKALRKMLADRNIRRDVLRFMEDKLGTLLLSLDYLQKKSNQHRFYFKPENLPIEVDSDSSESSSESSEHTFESSEYTSKGTVSDLVAAVENEIQLLLLEVTNSDRFNERECAFPKAELRSILTTLKKNREIVELKHKCIGGVLFAYGYIYKNYKPGWYRFKPEKMQNNDEDDLCSSSSSDTDTATEDSNLSPAIFNELDILMRETVNSRKIDPKTYSIKKSSLRQILNKIKKTQNCLRSITQKNLGSLLLVFGYCENRKGRDQLRYFFKRDKLPDLKEGK